MTDREKNILIKQKLYKADKTLSEIKNLIHLGYYENAINRIYYACFYCVGALLASIDIYPKSHKGVLMMFNIHYIKEGRFQKELGRFYQNIFDQRLLADYDDSYEASMNMAEELLNNALVFFEHTQSILQEK